MKTAYVLFAAAAWSGGAFASTAAEREFVTKAANAGAEEVVLGRLATEQGRSEAVKTFGQRMVDDHTRAGEALKAAARQDGIAMPDGVGSKPPGSEKLAGLRGADFDRAFARTMVQDHEEAVVLFRKEAQGSSESAVEAFARKTLPTLEEHLRMAKELSAHDAKDAKNRADDKQPQR